MNFGARIPSSTGAGGATGVKSNSTGATDGTLNAPARSTTDTGPGAAPSGTVTSAEVLRRTAVSATTSSASPGAPMKTTSSACDSDVPRSRIIEPVRTVPPAPQRAAHASFVTVAVLEAAISVGAATVGTSVGTGACACPRATAGARRHAATTYAVVRKLRPNRRPSL